MTSPGVIRRFTVAGADGQQRPGGDVSQLPAVIRLACHGVRRADRPGHGQGGHLAYHEFIIASESDLDRAFQQFNSAGATELASPALQRRRQRVLACGLASMLGGTRTDGKTFADIRFNSRNADRDFVLPMTTNIGILPGPVLRGLTRVFVITSPSTASASELVINALRPFMPVVLVGERHSANPMASSRAHRAASPTAR